VAYGQEGTAITALREVTGQQALLVVDYAETRIELGQMLACLASPAVWACGSCCWR
jgi:hypothetical protein